MKNLSPERELVLRGHLSRINHLTFSPDGTLLATSGEHDMTIRLWNVETGELLRIHSLGKPGWITRAGQAAFSPQGDTLYGVNDDVGLFAWSVESGELLYEVPLRDCRSVALSPDGRFAAVDCWREHVRPKIFDLRTNQYLTTPFQADLTVGEFSYDGTALLLEGQYFDKRVYDVTTGECLLVSSAHQGWNILGNRLLRLGGKSVLSTTYEEGQESGNAVKHRCEDFRTGESFWIETPGPWRHADVSLPDGNLVASDFHTPAIMFDPLDLREPLELPSGPGYDVSMAATQDGRLIAIGDASGAIRILSTAGWTVKRLIPGARGLSRNGVVAVTSDSKLLIVVDEDRRWRAESATVWSLEASCPVGEKLKAEEPPAPTPQPQSSSGNVVHIAISCCGAGCSRRPRERWEIQTDEGRVLGYDTELEAAYDDADRFDEVTSRVAGGRRRKDFAALSPNGRWFGYVEEDGVSIFDSESGSTRVLPYNIELGGSDEIVKVAVSNDGRRVAAGFSFSKPHVLVFDFKRRMVRNIRSFGDTFDSLAFSADGTMLAIGDAYQIGIGLVNLKTGRRRSLFGHSDNIRSLVFTPDGKYLISAASDGQAIVWDAKTFDRIVTLMRPDPGLWVAFTPERRYQGSVGCEKLFAETDLLR